MTAALPAAGPETVGWRRTLLLLWLGQVVSHLGDALFLVGIFFLALEVTGSKAASGLLIATNFLPALALGLFAGVFVDRHDRRRVMIAADLVRAAAVGAIPLLHAWGHLGPAALAAAMFGLATGTTLFNPAIKSYLPEVVPRAHLTTGIAVIHISEYGALVAGPALAAVAIPRWGTIHLFTIDAVTFLFSAVCLMLLPRRARAVALPVAPALSLVSVWREVRAGLAGAYANPVLRRLLVLAAVDNLLIMGLAHVATPLLVKERLGLGPEAYARAQMFFFLGISSASALFWFAGGRRLPKGPTILVGIVLDGLTFLPFAFCRTLEQVQLAMFVHALTIPLIVVPRTVIIQHTIPGALHGRTFALLNVTVFGMTAISSGLVGILSERVAPQTLFVVLGLAGALPGLAGFLLPSLRVVRDAR